MSSPAPSANRPAVSVLMCTWHANTGLDAQLDSIAAQDWPIRLHVHDDASSDDTVARARAHRSNPEIHCNTANLGFVGNFENALRQALDRQDSYIALSDQDDIWHTDRVSSGMHRLLAEERVHGSEHPILVHSDVNLIDKNGQALATSFLRYRGYATSGERHVPTLLGQSGVLGNTVLMNHAMAKLALPFPAQLHTHDWWLGVLAELYGTRLLLTTPSVDYRLHESNTSNTLDSMRSRRQDSARRAVCGGLLRQDFRLPFKEDTRVQALIELLSSPQRYPALNPDDERTIREFIEYLTLGQPRTTLLRRLLRDKFLKPAVLHKIRVALALLTTRRYA